MSEKGSGDLVRGSEGTPASLGDSDATLPSQSMQAERSRAEGEDGAPERTQPQARGKSRLHRGDSLGRYLILEQLGSGAMGEVLAAWDPQLDRKVALKILHRGHTRDREDNERHQTRLLREAQALARLTHPNVVIVHDVGTHEDEVFLAMEMAEGQTLTRWLEEAGANPERLMPVLIAAGQGLAAAHAAGLVHRDFKPDNVIVQPNGQPKVLDFGLARADAQSSASPTRPADLESQEVLSAEITREGSLVGSPAYMAPEQLEGKAADAASDQFAFCVVLWEALCGERPFAGDSVAALAFAVNRGELRKPARRLAPRTLAALKRGLSVDPSQRWPSMQALLQGLQKPPLPVAKVLLGGLAGATAAVAIFMSVFPPTPAPAPVDPCSGGEEQIAEVWSSKRAKELHGVFTATGRPYAQPLWAKHEARLEDYAGRWAAAHREACEVHRRQEQSDAIFDQRVACLDRARWKLHRRLEVLGDLKAAEIDKSGSVLPSPEEIELCARPDQLQVQAPRPEDANAAAHFDDLQGDFGRVEALMGVGRYKAALELAEGFEARVAELDELAPLAEPRRTLRATARYHLGVMHWLGGEAKDSIDPLNEAYLLAAGSGLDRVAADAAAELVHVLGGLLNQRDEALEWAELARASLRRAQLDPKGDPRLANSLGIVYEQQGEFEKAAEAYEIGRKARERRFGREDIGVANALNNIALVRELQGKYPEAEAAHREALEIRATLGGPGHPEVADSYNNLALVLQSTGKHREAVEALGKSLEIRRAALGEDNIGLSSAFNNRASSYIALGDYDAAQSDLVASLKIRSAKLDPGHPRLSSVQKNLGQLARLRGEFKEARALLQQVRVDLVVALGEAHPYVGEIDYFLGELERDLDRPAPAARRFEQALVNFEEAFPDGHPYVDQSKRELALALLDQGRARDQGRIDNLLDEALKDSLARLGPLHPAVADHHLARLSVALNRTSEDLRQRYEAAQASITKLPQLPPPVAAQWELLRLAYAQRQGEPSEVREDLLDAVASRRLARRRDELKN